MLQGSVPFAFAGGPTATSNPEPFSAFLDFFALGDGEELLVEIAECLRVCKRARLTRADSLLRLARDVEGVYVPQFYMAPEGMGGAVVPVAEGVPARPVRRVAAPDPFSQVPPPRPVHSLRAGRNPAQFIPSSVSARVQVGLIPFVQTVHDRMTIEIRRGCTRGCRFCQPGMLTRPARDVDPDDVVAAVTDGIRKTGYNGFSLLSLSCSDYLALPSVGLQARPASPMPHTSSTYRAPACSSRGPSWHAVAALTVLVRVARPVLRWRRSADSGSVRQGGWCADQEQAAGGERQPLAAEPARGPL